MIDAKAMLDMSVTGALDTKYTPVPVGDYLGLITEVGAQGGPQKEDPTKAWLRYDYKIEVQDEGVKALLGRDKVTMTFGIMVDTTPEGGLDMGKGKNVQLGRFREALGQNSPSDPWNPRMPVGHPIRISVKHEPGFKNPQELVGVISGVTKA